MRNSLAAATVALMLCAVPMTVLARGALPVRLVHLECGACSDSMQRREFVRGFRLSFEPESRSSPIEPEYPRLALISSDRERMRLAVTAPPAAETLAISVSQEFHLSSIADDFQGGNSEYSGRIEVILEMSLAGWAVRPTTLHVPYSYNNRRVAFAEGSVTGRAVAAEIRRYPGLFDDPSRMGGKRRGRH